MKKHQLRGEFGLGLIGPERVEIYPLEIHRETPYGLLVAFLKSYMT